MTVLSITTHRSIRATTAATLLLGTLGLAAIPAPAASADLDNLLSQYRAAADSDFSAARGQQLFMRNYGERSCSVCHTDDPRNPGKHQKTGKPIEPLAPSANPKRLTDQREMTKWLLRNCKWTLERECSAQEKGDFLTWLREQ